MVQVAIHGAAGRMGQSIASVLANDPETNLVAAMDREGAELLGRDMGMLTTGTPLEETLRFTSPAYLLEAYVTGRHFAQSPDLYGPIEMLNPDSKLVIEGFRSAAAELAGILEAGDQEAFDQVFADVRSFFGEFTDEALEQSAFLIDRLVELSAGRSST